VLSEISLTKNNFLANFLVLAILLITSGCGGSGDSENVQVKPVINQAPEVVISYSDSQTIVGNSIDLSATVIDDGLPSDNLSFNWRVVNPADADVEFTNPLELNTAVTFHSAGLYTIEFSSSDSQYTDSQSAIIRVDPVNQAPVSNAGIDQTITLPTDQIVLTGTYSDDDLPGVPHSYLWELIDPQNVAVVIDQPTALSTNVTLPHEGDFVFQLTINDGELATSDLITITVNPPIIGTFPRPNNQTCIAPNLLRLNPTKITIEKAFPELPHLGEVTALKQAPGDNLHWYALLPQGKIVEFVNNSLSTTYVDFINLENIVRYDTGGELGLLGMAFHPDYRNNGEIFVHYTMEEVIKVKKNDVTRVRSIISRFSKINNDWNEEIILKINQPELTNNGGNLDFDHNGYLLISLGDGGSDNDTLGLAQDTTSLLGSMLRIDIDNGSPYAIPADNPFATNNICADPEVVNNANDCPEIYAYGLRKPNYWSVDSAINSIWAGDNGPNSGAEINVIENGSNYGWNIMEGSQCNLIVDPNCDQTGLILPVYDYEFTNPDRNVVSGYVYRGSELDFLYGNFLFGDTATGKLFASKLQGNQYVTEELLDTNQTISGFARSNTGDLYLLDPTPGVEAKGNNIWKIVPDLIGTEAGQVATNLSETGCVEPTVPTQASSAMISYDVINPLWTDNAEKQRYFAIPDGTTINVTATGDFEFPVGSVLMKHFILNGQYIETRLLMYHPEGWLGYSYEWQYDNNGNPIDAIKLDRGEAKSVGNQTWYYPSSQDCLECHTADTGRVIGPEVLQLNREYTFPENGVYTSNQLLSYEQMGLLSATIPSVWLDNKLVALDDMSATNEERAKSYLHSNCAYCHSPTAPSSFDMDFRYTTTLADMNICNVQAMSGDMGLVNPLILNPTGTYDFPNSVLPLRMEADINSGNRMPPLGSEVIDSQAVTIIKNWINDISFCP
jgi:uncharacterized repeat protein (TIGR03806 family)